jgi:hypothetical protein
MFIGRTVRNILRNIKGDTEVIVVLDGVPADPPLPAHPRVLEVLLNKSIGQRAATNLAARLSRAKYVMKTDAHCAFGPGFDVIMMADMQDDWTMIPMMYNLHAFDWVCSCGFRRYQGPTAPCEECGKAMTREMIWKPKKSPETTAMRFDQDLKFAYWSKYKKRQTGDLVDTMSLLGACWMATRKKYWELGLCDEEHGSWGQQGTEVACKTWLSGGRLVCTKKTWFSHMFRTQGGDFGFPYSISARDVSIARKHSQKLFLDGKWKGAKHPLSWLISKFAPVPDWNLPPLSERPSKGLVYYTDSRLDEQIMLACQNQLQLSRNGHEIISVSLEPTLFGNNITLDAKRGIPTMFKQILAGLEASTADVIFLVEHDVLYHPSHFDFVPPKRDTFYYNQNRWMVNAETGHALFHYASSTSGLCAYRELLVEHYRKRVAMVESAGHFTYKMGFEPGTHNRAERVDDSKSDTWLSEYPNIDLRHGQNLTPSRWRKDQFRSQRYTKGWTEADEVPGWGVTKGRMNQFLDGLYTPDGAMPAGDNYG